MIIKGNLKALWFLFEFGTLRVIKPVKKGKNSHVIFTQQQQQQQQQRDVNRRHHTSHHTGSAREHFNNTPASHKPKKRCDDNVWHEVKGHQDSSVQKCWVSWQKKKKHWICIKKHENEGVMGLESHTIINNISMHYPGSWVEHEGVTCNFKSYLKCQALQQSVLLSNAPKI